MQMWSGPNRKYLVRLPHLYHKNVLPEKNRQKSTKKKTKMKDNYFLSLSFWLIFHPLWSSGLKCSSKLKMWHLYISRFSTIKRCGFNGFTGEHQCIKIILPATHISKILFLKSKPLIWNWCIRSPNHKRDHPFEQHFLGKEQSKS